MISDEIREQLSAYVDGELRQADAERVAKLVRSDPRLQREVQAYRHLGQKLRAWDRAENEGELSPQVRARALARATSHRAARRIERRSRILSLVMPLAAAAAVLVAVGTGFFLGAGEAEQATSEPTLSADLVAPLTELPSVTVQLPPPTGPRAVPTGSPRSEELDKIAAALPELIPDFTVYVMEEGRPYTPRARDLKERMEVDETRFEQERYVRELEKVQESRSVPGDATTDLSAQVEPFTPVTVSIEDRSAVVALERKAADVGIALGKPRLFAPGSELGREEREPGGDRSEVMVHNPGREPRLVLMGEVLRIPGSGNAWAALADTWIGADDVQFVPVLRLDRDGAPAAKGKLVADGTMVGPVLRRHLTGIASRREAAAVPGKERPEAPPALSKKASRREIRTRDRLLRGIRDGKTTGFAVFAGKELKGVELFATHELMVECAPRLLLGYVREVGTRVRVKPLPKVHAELKQKVEALIEEVASAEGRGREFRKEGWPANVRCVALDAIGERRIRAHGLLLNTRPLHLTLLP